MHEGDSLQVARFFRFMRLAGTSLFSILRIERECIHAVVAWEEDCRMGIPEPGDTQEVRWVCDTDPRVDDALAVGEYAYDAGWISIDRMTVDCRELEDNLGWDAKRVADAIDKLVQLKVQMIDDGEETDSFFLHT